MITPPEDHTVSGNPVLATNVSAAEIQAEVDHICKHPAMARSKILQRFLRFTVQETLAGNGAQLKEYAVALSALGRAADFDPRHSSIVRSQARNLRNRLLQYYQKTKSPIRIEYHTGSYVPVFSRVTEDTPATLKAPQPRTGAPSAAWERVCNEARKARQSGDLTKVRQAATTLSELLDRAPGYARALAELSIALSMIQLMELRVSPSRKARAKALAMEALAFSPQCSEAWIAISLIRMMFDGDTEAAVRFLDRADMVHTADPLSAALRALGHMLCLRLGEAERILREAIERNQTDALLLVTRAWLAFCERRFRDAGTDLDAADALSPNCCLSGGLRPFVLELTGTPVRAEISLRRIPDVADAVRAWFRARQGQPEAARELIRKAEATQDGGVPEILQVLLLTELNEYDRAVAIVARGVRRQEPFTLFADLNPLLDPLRHHCGNLTPLNAAAPHQTA